jgi:hypothetical protein
MSEGRIGSERDDQGVADSGSAADREALLISGRAVPMSGRAF